MATRFWLGNDGSVNTPPDPGNNANLPLKTSAAVAGLLNVSTEPPAGSSVKVPIGTSLGSANPYDAFYWWFQVSAVTISGTITFNCYANEQNMTDNTGMSMSVVRCDSSGTPISTVADQARGVELGTSFSVQNWTATPTSTSFVDGDYMRLGVDVVNVGTIPAAAGFTDFRYRDTAANTGDSWVEFTETIVAGTPSSPTAQTGMLV